MILGLVISTIGAFLASTKSICDNLKIGKVKDEKDDGEFKPISEEMQAKKIEVEE